MPERSDAGTPSNESKHKVHETDDRFQLLVNGVQDYAIYMLDPTGHIVSWNTGARRIKGYTPDEIIGKHFSLFFTPEDAARGKPAAILAAAERDGTYQEEGWRVRKDGSLFWASIVLSALRDPGGNLRGFGKVTRDLTERKRAEEERERLREREHQLRQERETREQMEAAVRMRDTFLTLLAHELRTPLTSVLGNAQLLLRNMQREEAISERDRRRAQVVVDQAARLDQIVQLQIDIARLQTGQLRIERIPVDIGAVVRSLVAQAQPMLRHHTLTYRESVASLTVAGDELRLRQVLQNLLQNAVKYSPEGGSVYVTVEQQGANAQIDIVDSGIGIPQASLPHVFDRFYRAPNVDEWQISGLGIGLYLVKELIALHDGTVQIHSAEGQGTTVRITLPLIAESVPSEDVAAQPLEALPDGARIG